MRKVHSIKLTQAQRGWVCEIFFAVPTKRQFTNERHTVRGYGHEGALGLFGILSALWNTRRNMQLEGKRLQSLPGEFSLA